MTRETPREDDEDDDDYRWIFLIASWTRYSAYNFLPDGPSIQ